MEVDSSSLETQIRNSKAYLLKQASDGDGSLYEHLASMLAQMLKERPNDALKILENTSREEKRAKFRPCSDAIQDHEDESSEVTLAKTHSELFVQNPANFQQEMADVDPDEEIETPLPDIMELAHYFHLGGVGINKQETFRVFLALKKLVDSNPILTCRFWGKMFGLQNNYYIAEVEFREGEDPEEQYSKGPDEEKIEEEESEHVLSQKSRDSLNVEEDEIPKPDYKPPPEIPMEYQRTGCNKKVYFLCTEPGNPWIRLPPVTPAQIVTSRQIKKFFTGNPNAPIVSYPPFPGNETNYLRAIIARISASTHVSPQGYFMFEEDEDEEDEGVRDTFVTNPEFEGLSVSELIDSSLTNWVHHIQYILPQGRCSWFNHQSKDEEEEEEEEEDEEREEPDEPEPEVGPPLLTPLSEDTDIDGFPAWTAVRAPSLVPQHSVAILHSNLWPGGHCFAIDRKFENVYVGWGQKYSSENYSPPAPPTPQEEYPSGPEITEADDPTVEEENAVRAAQLEASDEGEEEGDDEEFDDDDD
ncbi:radial spoke head protein 4 homolog A-like [Dendronephthya gigantea]|uniref:radial spoke head protein 4 homolog A-like n=1 Tax=Dendronephthya gigantea TaxID=151771 RepID=UPI001068E61B|nr:radial spoke head protein 4 homolog A-like [Dendronephthya gigantea]